MEKDNWEEYFISGTDTLKNKLSITNKEELLEKEKIIALKKLTLLELFPVEGNFDSKHLKDIHKFIFEDIYPFAGLYRNCTLAKTTRSFYDPEIIEDELSKALKSMNDEYKNIKSKEGYAFFLADTYYNLMTIHPFREGNGRSVREFLREFVISKNNELGFSYDLDFSKVNKNDMLKAVEYKYIYPSMLMMEFYKALIEAPDINKNKGI